MSIGKKVYTNAVFEIDMMNFYQNPDSESVVSN